MTDLLTDWLVHWMTDLLTEPLTDRDTDLDFYWRVQGINPPSTLWLWSYCYLHHRRLQEDQTDLWTRYMFYFIVFFFFLVESTIKLNESNYYQINTNEQMKQNVIFQLGTCWIITSYWVKKKAFNTNNDIGMISNKNDNDNIDDKIEMMWLAVTSSRAAGAGLFCHTNLIHTWWRVFIVWWDFVKLWQK